VSRLEFHGNRSKSIKSSEQKTSKVEAALGNKRKLEIAGQQPIDIYSDLSHKDLPIKEIDPIEDTREKKKGKHSDPLNTTISNPLVQ